jgi:hypothetical protein
LNLSVIELAEWTGLALNTVRRAESTNEVAPITTANMKVLADSLAAAGVIFIPADEQGPGVRLKTPEAQPMRVRRRDAPAGD